MLALLVDDVGALVENCLLQKKPDCVRSITKKLGAMTEKACEFDELVPVVTYDLCCKLL